MLLPMAFLQLLEKDGRKFKGRNNLTKEELQEILEFDDEYYQTEEEHIISNYQELQKQLDAMNNHD